MLDAVNFFVGCFVARREGGRAEERRDERETERERRLRVCGACA